MLHLAARTQVIKKEGRKECLEFDDVVLDLVTTNRRYHQWRRNTLYRYAGKNNNTDRERIEGHLLEMPILRNTSS